MDLKIFLVQYFLKFTSGSLKLIYINKVLNVDKNIEGKNEI